MFSLKEVLGDLTLIFGCGEQVCEYCRASTCGYSMGNWHEHGD